MDDDKEADFCKTFMLSECNQVLMTLSFQCLCRKYHRITERFELEESSRRHEIQPSLKAGLTLNLDQDGQGAVQWRFENLQGWQFYSRSDHPVLVA